MRLTDLFRRDADGGRLLTWRELAVYVRQMPAGARTRLAQGDKDSLWGLAEHLQALVIDELRAANWQRANEGLKKGQQSRPPRPFPRPGVGGKSDKNSPERQAKRAEARKRAAARRAAIAAGEIT